MTINDTASAAVPRRLAWADAAKGVCIGLVVLYHVTTKHQDALGSLQTAQATSIWTAVSDVLTAVRMPLFFVISGYFAARAVRRPWGQVFRRRVAQNLYLHVVWLLVAVLVHRFVGSLTSNKAESLGDVLLAAVTAFTGLWYMYGLAVYFVLVKVGLRVVPGPVVVACAAMVTVASDAGLLPQKGNVDAILENLVWFAAGVVFADHLTRFTMRPRAWVVVATGAGFLGATAFLALVDNWYVHVAGQLPLRLLAVLAGVSVAVAVAQWLPRVAEPLASFGRRTLPVYVMHGLLLIGLHRVLAPVLDEPDGFSPFYAVVHPLLVSVLLVVACLALESLLKRCGAGWLFSLPEGSTTARRRVPSHPEKRAEEVMGR